MTGKLTLSLDTELIRFAHACSRETGQSISGMVENFFRNIKQSENRSSLPPELSDLYGILQGEKIPDKKAMRKAAHEKRLGRSQRHS